MEQENKIIPMLELMSRPAFCVDKGRIFFVNTAAKGFFLELGTPMASLVANGAEEYKSWKSGTLFLTLNLSGKLQEVQGVWMEDQQIFLLSREENLSELQALALAAMELREPLSGILTVTGRMFPGLTEAANQQQAAQVNRRLFQMLRTISNMSDAYRYARQDAVRLEYVQVDALLREIFDRAMELLDQAGIVLEYSDLPEPVYTLADPERLERAVYNLLSNAAKFAPKDGRIQAKLSCRGNRLSLSVCDNGPGMETGTQSQLFDRFLREPGLEDIRNGVGLGLMLVRSTAALHGGTVLIDHPEGVGTRITMTLQIRQAKDAVLRCPALRIDYAGEWDHGLLELADCLPVSLYSSNNLK